MFEKELPARPDVEQYKKQAKDLAGDCARGSADALARMRKNHPRLHKLSAAELNAERVSLMDAQLVIAREHGFESWPRFAAHIETLRLIREIEAITDPVVAFIEVACAPRHTGHASGALEHAEMIRSRYPEVAGSSIHTAAILGDETVVRGFLARDPKLATATGGPHGWDALTHLCFSRYLRLDPARSEGFVATAQALLDAGASANTGWQETIDHPAPRRILESVLYGAAAVARHPKLTQLLLERGADPNDEETPYHLPEGYDNTVMRIVLESGRLNATSLVWMLVRKADWHDADGLRMLLEHGADPNGEIRIGTTPLQHAMRRDNGLEMIEMFLDYGADPFRGNIHDGIHDGSSAIAIAARRGRGDVLAMLKRRGIALDLSGVDRLIAACASADREAIQTITKREPRLLPQLVAEGGKLLAEFAGTGNAEGVRCLLDLGVRVDALYSGDLYFDLARDSTALHSAAWHAWPSVVHVLLERGTPVHALDGKGRTALQLAVKACVDSYWTQRRSPDSIEALLNAGAAITGVEIPCGYDAVDVLLRRAAG